MRVHAAGYGSTLYSHLVPPWVGRARGLCCPTLVKSCWGIRPYWARTSFLSCGGYARCARLALLRMPQGRVRGRGHSGRCGEWVRGRIAELPAHGHAGSYRVRGVSAKHGAFEVLTPQVRYDMADVSTVWRTTIVRKGTPIVSAGAGDERRWTCLAPKSGPLWSAAAGEASPQTRGGQAQLA